SRGAVLTIVTNDALRETVESWGGRGFVLPDPLPDPPPERERFPLDPTKVNVAAVFSFYEDEPVDEMLAVASLPDDMHVWITGDSSRVSERQRASLSPRVTLTGFLSRASYDSLLSRCDAVIVLCTRPHTLLCGAYEAVAAHKPLVTSESDAMRHHFRKGVVWTGNSTAEIEAALRQVAARRDELAAEMREADREMRADWQRTCDRLLDDLSSGGVARADLPVPRWRRA
ncbi:MAG: glycosyltransferase, partial [Alphaproteobacteria bacterium]